MRCFTLLRWAETMPLSQIHIDGKSEEELGRLSGQVLMSALAAPVGQHAEEIAEDGKGKNGRLTALLGLPKTPNSYRTCEGRGKRYHTINLQMLIILLSFPRGWRLRTDWKQYQLLKQ
jgi:hypothetical protein